MRIDGMERYGFSVDGRLISAMREILTVTRSKSDAICPYCEVRACGGHGADIEDVVCRMLLSAYEQGLQSGREEHEGYDAS